MIADAFGYNFYGGDLIFGLFMQHSRNPAAKAQDHKRPDQRKINHIGNDGIKASDKEHLSFYM